MRLEDEQEMWCGMRRFRWLSRRCKTWFRGRIEGEGAGGAYPHPCDDLLFSNTTGILQKKNNNNNNNYVVYWC